ncbi:MAG: hypothetical protein JW900_00310 [Anaerolineae bacterium]|nr:hypothetical protein [Anaerolineae bacterium]
MTEQDVDQQPEPAKLHESASPISWYLGPLAILFLLSLVLYIAPSSPLRDLLLLLFGGLSLITATLILTTFIWVRVPFLGWAVVASLLIVWGIWAFYTLKPLWPLSLETALYFAPMLLSVFLPLFLAVMVFFIGLRIVSGFLLPIEPPFEEQSSLVAKVRAYLQDERFTQAYELFAGYVRRHYFPMYVMTRARRQQDKLARRGKGNAYDYRGKRGVIISDCDHIVAVSDGITFKGVQGPGVIFTNKFDLPQHVIDLRPQLRTKTIQAWTQDGIEVKVLFFAPFQLDRGGQPAKLGQAIPYDEEAAFDLVHHQVMEYSRSGLEPKQRIAWDDLPVEIGTSLLQDVLGKYRFDELYEPSSDGGKWPRPRIADEFADQFETKLKEVGLVPVGGGISNIKPARGEQVLPSRTQSWRAHWARQVMQLQAKGQEERLRRIEQVRAAAYVELVEKLGQRIVDLEQAGVPVESTAIIPQLLQVLDEIVHRPAVWQRVEYTTRRRMQVFREDVEAAGTKKGELLDDEPL